jgi:hypothetical protein
MQFRNMGGCPLRQRQQEQAAPDAKRPTNFLSTQAFRHDLLYELIVLVNMRDCRQSPIIRSSATVSIACCCFRSSANNVR